MATISIATPQTVGARTQDKRCESDPPTGRVALVGAELIFRQRRLLRYDDTPQTGRGELMTPVSSGRCVPGYGPVVFSSPTSHTGPWRSRDGMREQYVRVTCEAHVSPALFQPVTLPIRLEPKWQGRGAWESEGTVVLVIGRAT